MLNYNLITIYVNVTFICTSTLTFFEDVDLGLERKIIMVAEYHMEYVKDFINFTSPHFLSNNTKYLKKFFNNLIAA